MLLLLSKKHKIKSLSLQPLKRKEKYRNRRKENANFRFLDILLLPNFTYHLHLPNFPVFPQGNKPKTQPENQ